MNIVFKGLALKTSPTPIHIHDTMFIKGEYYVVREYISEVMKNFVSVEGKFQNSLGGSSRCSRAVPRSEAREYLLGVETK